MKYSGIGGQAVIEGIMMKNGDRYSTAVRKPDKTIAVMEDKYESLTTRFPIFALPFFRGIFSFIDSLILGMKTLSYSSSFFEDDEDSKPSKFEEKLIKIFGDRLDKVITDKESVEYVNRPLQDEIFKVINDEREDTVGN